METVHKQYPDGNKDGIAFTLTNNESSDKRIYLQDLTLYDFGYNIDYTTNVFSWIEERPVNSTSLSWLSNDDAPKTGSVYVLCCLRINPGAYPTAQSVIDSLNDRLMSTTTIGFETYRRLPCGLYALQLMNTDAVDSSGETIRFALYPYDNTYTLSSKGNYEPTIRIAPAILADSLNAIRQPRAIGMVDTRNAKMPRCVTNTGSTMLLDYTSNTLAIEAYTMASASMRAPNASLTRHAIDFGNGISTKLGLSTFTVPTDALIYTNTDAIRLFENGDDYTEFLINHYAIDLLALETCFVSTKVFNGFDESNPITIVDPGLNINPANGILFKMTAKPVQNADNGYNLTVSGNDQPLTDLLELHLKKPTSLVVTNIHLSDDYADTQGPAQLAIVLPNEQIKLTYNETTGSYSGDLYLAAYNSSLKILVTLPTCDICGNECLSANPACDQCIADYEAHCVHSSSPISLDKHTHKGKHLTCTINLAGSYDIDLAPVINELDITGIYNTAHIQPYDPSKQEMIAGNLNAVPDIINEGSIDYLMISNQEKPTDDSHIIYKQSDIDIIKAALNDGSLVVPFEDTIKIPSTAFSTWNQDVMTMGSSLNINIPCDYTPVSVQTPQQLSISIPSQSMEFKLPEGEKFVIKQDESIQITRKIYGATYDWPGAIWVMTEEKCSYTIEIISTVELHMNYNNETKLMWMDAESCKPVSTFDLNYVHPKDRAVRYYMRITNVTLGELFNYMHPPHDDGYRDGSSYKVQNVPDLIDLTKDGKTTIDIPSPETDVSPRYTDISFTITVADSTANTGYKSITIYPTCYIGSRTGNPYNMNTSKSSISFDFKPLDVSENTGSNAIHLPAMMSTDASAMIEKDNGKCIIMMDETSTEAMISSTLNGSDKNTVVTSIVNAFSYRTPYTSGGDLTIPLMRYVSNATSDASNITFSFDASALNTDFPYLQYLTDPTTVWYIDLKLASWYYYRWLSSIREDTRAITVNERSGGISNTADIMDGNSYLRYINDESGGIDTQLIGYPFFPYSNKLYVRLSGASNIDSFIETNDSYTSLRGKSIAIISTPRTYSENVSGYTITNEPYTGETTASTAPIVPTTITPSSALVGDKTVSTIVAPLNMLMDLPANESRTVYITGDLHKYPLKRAPHVLTYSVID